MTQKSSNGKGRCSRSLQVRDKPYIGDVVREAEKL